jgi:hypothetical protein
MHIGRLLLGVILVTVCIYGISGQTSYGQIDVSFSVSIAMSPESPRPNQEVTLTINDSSVNFNNTAVTWYVNGQVFRRGVGERKITINAGELGTRTNVRVEYSNGFSTVIKTRIISPSEIDFLWQGSVYTPPFYKGRPLWTKQSQLTITAIPHVTGPNGGRLDSNTLVYRWTRNTKIIGENSGIGRNSFTMLDSPLSRDENIGLEVFDANNILLTKGSINLLATHPTILIYEDNPLYGTMFHREVGQSYIAREREISFTAVPLFFSVPSRTSSNLSYEWGADGDIRTGNSVTYRVPDGTSGTSNVRVDIKHRDNFIQNSTRNFLVQFGQ